MPYWQELSLPKNRHCANFSDVKSHCLLFQYLECREIDEQDVKEIKEILKGMEEKSLENMNDEELDNRM